MNDETKKKINERYERELGKGEFFWPDSIFKDVIVSLGIFVLLIVLATFVGVVGEPKADPSDTAYVPRPEWYFLFLFKFLALYGQIPVIGKIEWLATVVIPSIGIGLILLLPFIDRNSDRYYAKRAMPLGIMAVMVVDMVILSLISDIPTVPPVDATLPIKLSAWLQPHATLTIPGIVILLLIVLAFLARFDKGISWKPMAWITGLGSMVMVALTIAIFRMAPPAAVTTETEVATTLVDQILAGQDVYSTYCVECHGEDGKLAKITGVAGLENKEITPINSRDVLYTITDSDMYEVIAYGRPNAGMTPFGKAYGGELSKSQIDYMITYMRYMWDDRFEIPAEALKPLFPPLAEGEVPSYDVHIQPIVKRYCVSCHRAGKDNRNYLMTSYEEILTSGDSKGKNVMAGDENSILLQVIQGKTIPDPANPAKVLIRTMPTNSALKPNVVDVFVRWIMNGMPRTAEDAAALSATPAP